MDDISIEAIEPDSALLTHVIALGDKFKKFLGLFPKDAFADRAERKSILVARSGNTVAGYLLFYRAKKGHIQITHMCVDEAFRKVGVARRLFVALIERSKNFHCITLSCRRDFDACAFWPKLGFVAVTVRPGKGNNPTELVDYRFTVPHQSLLEEDRSDAQTTDVVIDANVFFDFEDPARNEADESDGLLADWLQPMIRLCITEELHNELKNSPTKPNDAARRLGSLHTIESNSVQFLNIHPEVVKLFPKARTEREEADRRQLARAIVSAASVFVTRDTELLEYADDVYRRFGLRVMRPSGLIGSFDEIRNEAEYQRDRLVGTCIRTFKLSSHAELIAREFFDQSCEQKASDLRRRIDLWFSSPDRFVFNVIAEGNVSAPIEELTLLACVCMERTTSGGLKIVLVRTRRRTDLPRKFGTIQRCVLMAILQGALYTGSWHVEVAGDAGPADLLGRLTELGFHRVGEQYFKVCPKIVDVPSEILANIESRCNESHLKQQADNVLQLLSATGEDVAFEIEKRIWPAKVIGCGIPTFVVAIRPRWAKHLIGAGANDVDLFGADTELAFNFESVYYRAVASKGLVSRSRILWYVSEDSDFNWSGQLIACSQVDAVELGTAKRLFKKYERFGVYNFKDVISTANGDPSKEIMAIRFSNTEPLPRPWSFSEAKAVLSDQAGWNTFISPMEITEELFLKFYGTGKGDERK